MERRYSGLACSPSGQHRGNLRRVEQFLAGQKVHVSFNFTGREPRQLVWHLNQFFEIVLDESFFLSPHFGRFPRMFELALNISGRYRVTNNPRIGSDDEGRSWDGDEELYRFQGFDQPFGQTTVQDRR